MHKIKTFLSENGKQDLLPFNIIGRQAQAIYFINILKIFLAVFFITFNLIYITDLEEKHLKIVRLTITIPASLLCILLLRIHKLHTAAIFTCTLSFLILFYFPVFFRLNPMEIYISHCFVTLAACLIPCFVFRIEDLSWILGLIAFLLLISITSDNIMIYKFGIPGNVFYDFYKEKILFLTIAKIGIVVFLSSTCIFILTNNRKYEADIRTMQEKLKCSNADLEKLVHERTQNLEEKNKRLLEYTYINSHLLRGPVARLKGLMLLAELDQSDSNIHFCHVNFNKCLGELDAIIEMINKILNEEDQNEILAIQEKVRKMYAGFHVYTTDSGKMNEH